MLGFCAPSARARDGHGKTRGHAHAHPLLVLTHQGKLRGQRSDGVDRFYAIPYAAPPVGEARFRPPQPPRPWAGVRAADAPPPRCPQTGGGGEEDCLYLSVLRPTQPRRAGPLPVLFWIHGGSFKVGSGLDNDPSRIVREGDTVMVMINYRLGQLGFLAHPELGAEDADGMSGQYGLLDQQQALRWVHDNIPGFGGDPSRITLAGGSAGGISVCAHLGSPAVADLFSGAAILSGACDVPPLDWAEQRGLEYAAAVGCPGPDAAACLRSKTAEELASRDSFGLPSVFPWGGAALPENPPDAISAGRARRVPVMIGGAEHESRSGRVQEYPMPEAAYVAGINAYFGEHGPAVLEQYPPEAYADPFYANTDVISDSSIDLIGPCINRRIAQAHSRFAPVYVYEFADDTAPIPEWAAANAPPGLQIGASHASDEVYWFDRPQESIRLDETQAGVARAMVRFLGRFARRGSPSRHHASSWWPRYDLARERVMRFVASGTEVAEDWVDRHECEFWSSIGY